MTARNRADSVTSESARLLESGKWCFIIYSDLISGRGSFEGV